MYKFIRAFFFLFPPEYIHHLSMGVLKSACSIKPFRKLISVIFSQSASENAHLSRKVWGLTFKNPVGLAAGFDKNALYLRELSALGFGHVEIGTVTPLPQQGNPKPRLYRLTKDKALLNRMGFNNDGVKIIAGRLREYRSKHPQSGIIIGGNIGKNKVTTNEDAWKDYVICFEQLMDCVDYFTVNVSSPNTPGLRALQEKDALRKILVTLQDLNEKQPVKRPILLKIAPDLTTEQVDDVVSLAIEIKLDGIVASNTTISRKDLATPETIVTEMGDGGISGRPVKEKSSTLVRYISKKTGGSIPIIASGGIFTTSDAEDKIACGATLVQVWTGFVYEGPGIVKKLLKAYS